MAASWQGGSYTKICLAAALTGSVGLALYYGYRKRQQHLTHGAAENKQVCNKYFLELSLSLIECTGYIAACIPAIRPSQGYE